MAGNTVECNSIKFNGSSTIFALSPQIVPFKVVCVPGRTRAMEKDTKPKFGLRREFARTREKARGGFLAWPYSYRE